MISLVATSYELTKQLPNSDGLLHIVCITIRFSKPIEPCRSLMISFEKTDFDT